MTGDDWIVLVPVAVVVVVVIVVDVYVNSRRRDRGEAARRRMLREVHRQPDDDTTVGGRVRAAHGIHVARWIDHDPIDDVRVIRDRPGRSPMSNRPTTEKETS
jgi:hypothetical protein